MKRYKWPLLLIPMGIFAWIAAHSTRFAGGEDGVMHHLFARYAPQHPENFFNLWAKPVYVLLSMPFAQFGFFGSILFSIILACLSGWLVWKTAKNLKLRFPWLAAVLLFGSTIYFYCVTAAITEILFGFVLIWSIFEITRKRYWLAAILVSFLPFVRSEGNGVILVFALGFLAIRAWKFIPLLATGTVMYSLAGAWHYHDILWVWHNHPYGDASAIYGSGSFWHYFELAGPIWGIPVYIFWIAGTLLFMGKAIKMAIKKEKPTEELWIWCFFIFGPYFVYLIGHSLVWYLGKSASLGLIRVMAAVMPACALICLYAFDGLLSLLNPRLKMLQYGLVLILAFVSIQSAFDLNDPPYHGDLEKEEIIKAGNWFRNSPYFENKKRVYYFAPSVAESFRINPFDPEQRGDLSEILWNRDIPSGSIIVWDAHFGPNECHLPIDTLLQRPELERIYHQVPEVPMKTLNNYDYEIYLFRKP